MKKLVAVAFVLLAACSTSESDPADDSSLACDHFRNIAADVSAGVLTDAELRDKLKEVYDNASIATPEVREAAREMLAALTAGDVDAFSVAISDMDAACTAAGS